MARIPPTPPRERFNVTIKRTIHPNYFTISGPGGIQRRERRFMPRWALQALAAAQAIETKASVDRAGRWCIAGDKQKVEERYVHYD